MDERYRNLMERNRTLLTKNLIITDDFYDLLLKEKVLPQSMIADVKEDGLSREERAERLMSALQLRTSAAFRRFRRVLLGTGHCFLADVMWDEESSHADMEETIASRFPAILERIPDDIRKKLITCLDSMVREKTLVTSWQAAPSDRLEVIKTRAADFKHERHLRETIQTMHTQVAQLQAEVKGKDEQLRSLTIEVQSLNKELERLRYEHVNDIEKQANFNTANSKTIIRLKERFDMLNANIAGINYQLRSFLGEESERCEGDPDNVKVTLLERNLKKVLQLANVGRENATSVSNEKEAVCALLGVKNTKYSDKSLTDVVKGHLQKEDKAKNNLLSEIQKLSDVLTRDTPTLSDHKANQQSVRTDLRFLAMQVAMVHAQIEHLYKKMVWKDAEIDSLRQEIQALRKNLSNVKTKTRSRVSSPEMTREMRIAYAHVNDYLREDKMEPVRSQDAVPARRVIRVKPPGSKPSSQGGPRRQISMPLVRDYDVPPTEV
ncbi:cilia- and flagella-associated protein 58-like [Haliotis rufescens]|uniref:cilia- and flagella-associated protein 58-like n=1 Tax=Haliotis rufescens TaxID=6454 RepID=UPI00201ED89E|nr:cilia- and flagella-associated protein 58-like [Haliotis rufescens]